MASENQIEGRPVPPEPAEDVKLLVRADELQAFEDALEADLLLLEARWAHFMTAGSTSPSRKFRGSIPAMDGTTPAVGAGE